MDRMIEDRARQCERCAISGPEPIKVPLHQCEEPKNVWQRVHIDFCGPTNGTMWFILVDAKSKWPEAIKMSKTTTLSTIKVLQGVFCMFGIPEQIVSDNGPQFSSSEFSDYCVSNGIQHITTAPYHPQSNGEAERFVQTFKKSLEKNSKERRTEEAVDLLLLNYRSMPHAAIGKSPAEAMFGRNIRTKFTMTGELNSLTYREQMNGQFNKRTKPREFHPADLVWVRSFRVGDDKWIPGVVLHRSGNVMCEVQTHHGTEKRHFNQLKSRFPLEERDVPTMGNSPTETTAGEPIQLPPTGDERSAPNVPQEQALPPKSAATAIAPGCSRVSGNNRDEPNSDNFSLPNESTTTCGPFKACEDLERCETSAVRTPTEMSRSRPRSPRRSRSPRKDLRRVEPRRPQKQEDRGRLWRLIQALEGRVKALTSTSTPTTIPPAGALDMGLAPSAAQFQHAPGRDDATPGGGYPRRGGIHGNRRPQDPKEIPETKRDLYQGRRTLPKREHQDQSKGWRHFVPFRRQHQDQSKGRRHFASFRRQHRERRREVQGREKEEGAQERL
ncbi:hypothetical protein L596_029004 [Steinernema carpocapsae]|uniref:Integrase catalytic domain-containing protein n=1 Tax=Steinernema carpocapsae TaxID=34508 RepID=A0A4U5LTC4_STECR|nr:hypothetical protein L596_029004 [Steinernema carpocapsae]